MDAFTAHLVDLFSPLGNIRARPMFGGTSLYCDGLIFGMTVNDVCYLKVDDENRPRFEALDLGPFTYEAHGKTMAMGYYQAPDSILDDPEEALDWAREAVEVSKRAEERKSAKKRRAK
jgi:DNA transformation protein